LNDEVRSASGLSVTNYQHGAVDADAPRYGEQANVEHHPQVTDYVPRRARAVVVTLLAGIGVAAGAQAIIRFAEPIAAVVPGVDAATLSDRLAGGMVAWSSAVALLMAAMLAKLTYSLRRHRVDDYAGRYRVWRWIAWGGVLASVNSIVHIHTLVPHVAVAATGMSLTASGSEWWLAPLALIGGWIFVRLLLEVGESRTSLATLLAAAACYGVAAAGAMGWAPAALGDWSGALTGALPLVGHTMALAGLMVFARYVVLDVQGLIDHAPRAAAPATAKESPAPAALAMPSASHQQSQQSQSWDDDAEDDEDEDGAGRKLSKADRKRLRKQQRAA
jgi:hypothetical protein